MDYNNIYAQNASVSQVPVTHQTQNIDKSTTYKNHIENVNLPDVNNADDFINSLTRTINTYQNPY
ncbi:hypothetical protein [Clostridium sp.]|jgi:hypothetical protein|uniref:hypothetical protein n=1 Tax=Clostridium sp. TaxID=1506 RepID=UPI00258C0ACD|nr:hypothetical protein [Clostridium sp.]